MQIFPGVWSCTPFAMARNRDHLGPESVIGMAGIRILLTWGSAGWLRTAARIAIDEVLKTIDRMEHRERHAPESDRGMETERNSAVETGCEANVA